MSRLSTNTVHLHHIFLIYGSFDNTVSSLDYAASNNKMSDKCWIERDADESGHGIIWVTIPESAWWEWRKEWKLL
jgi:hypothetical protein